MHFFVVDLRQHGFGLGMTTAPPPVKRHKTKYPNNEQANSGGVEASSVFARSYSMPLGCTGITGSYTYGSFSNITRSRHVPNACFHHSFSLYFLFPVVSLHHPLGPAR